MLDTHSLASAWLIQPVVLLIGQALLNAQVPSYC